MSEKVSVVTLEDRKKGAKRIVAMVEGKSHDLIIVCREDKVKDGYLLEGLFIEPNGTEVFVKSLINLMSPTKKTGLEEGESVVVTFFGNRKIRLEHRWNNKDNFFVMEYRIQN
jgi:hypothetical protein